MRVFSALPALLLSATLAQAQQAPDPVRTTAAQPNAVQPRAVVPSLAQNEAAQNQQAELDHLRSIAFNYGQLDRYAAANAALPPPAPGVPRVIFFGDSITDFWKLDQFFPAKGYLDRGISGQTTPQMLVRFRQDVIDLHPAVLVVLAGTNDLAGNTGPETLEQIEADFSTFADLLQVHGIRFVVSSITPVSSYGPTGASMLATRPPAKILELNAWLKQLCTSRGLVYLDYFTAMVDSAGMLRRELSNDGLHPNEAGYAVMSPLAQKAIDAALAGPPPPSMHP